MLRIILTYGTISGLIVILTALIGLYFSGGEGSFQFSAWLGYLTMLIALSMIFVAIKRFRDDHQGGVITFGTATLVGVGIAATAGVMYVVIWEVYLALTDHAFIGEYTESIIEARRTEGLDEAAMTELVTELENMKAQYANPLYRLPITFLEIFPIGLIIALISSAILRKSDILPASD